MKAAVVVVIFLIMIVAFGPLALLAIPGLLMGAFLIALARN